MKKYFSTLIAFAVTQMFTFVANASSVKITPLGSHDGEFCRFDRALIFEDPNGTRLIYDVGRTVAGAEDERLGDIDVILLSHVHGDHLGDRYIEKVNAVINIGDTFTTGPTEAAYVVNELVQPKSVIASHANEVATEEGKVIPGTKTDQFIRATKMPVFIPLSGQTMEFNGLGQCISGCQDSAQ